MSETGIRSSKIHFAIVAVLMLACYASLLSPSTAQALPVCSQTDGDVRSDTRRSKATDTNDRCRGALEKATAYCPAYSASPLYRPRRNSLTAGPDDDWQAMIENAGPDTEILLRDGDYEMTDYAVVIASPNVTIRGASGKRNAVRITGQGYATGSEGFMVLAANVTIADLSMSAIRNHAISIKPESGAARTHVYNVRLFDIGTQHIKGSSGNDSVGGVVACSSIGYTPGGAQGDYLGAIDIHSAVNWTIRDNYIYNINGDGSGCEVDIDCGTYVYGAPAVYLWNGARGSVVERNTIFRSDRGIALGLGRGHRGGVVRNNFIYRPAAGDAGIELWTAHDVLVEHNTVILGGDYPGAIEYRESNNVRIRNNLISVPPLDRGSNSGVVLTGNISNATVNDLMAPGDPHLRPGSRAIGAGVASNITTDIDGDTRAGRWDVGADQYTEASDDDDGVDGVSDRCPATPAGAIVNRNGCSIAQLVPCASTRVTMQRWKNHRQYVRRVARVSMTFVTQDLITAGERRKLVRIASRSRCGK